MKIMSINTQQQNQYKSKTNNNFAFGISWHTTALTGPDFRLSMRINELNKAIKEATEANNLKLVEELTEQLRKLVSDKRA